MLLFFTQYIGFILTYQHIGSAICAHSLVGLCVRETFFFFNYCDCACVRLTAKFQVGIVYGGRPQNHKR